jgi:hypothetical protein
LPRSTKTGIPTLFQPHRKPSHRFPAREGGEFISL